MMRAILYRDISPNMIFRSSPVIAIITTVTSEVCSCPDLLLSVEIDGQVNEFDGTERFRSAHLPLLRKKQSVSLQQLYNTIQYNTIESWQ